MIALAAHAGQARRPRRRRRAGRAGAALGGGLGRATRAGCGSGRLDELDALAAAAAAGPAELLEALLAEAEAIWTAPHRRRAAVLGPEEAADARAAAELRGAARELRSLAEADPELLAGGPEEVLEALAGAARCARTRRPAACSSRPRRRSARAASAPCSCAGCRTASSRAGRRPSRSSTTTRAPSLARASGLVLRRHEDVLGEERHLFYACVSRPEEVLFLSFRSSDEDGDPLQPSPFVADVRALFTDELWRERGTRLLAEVTWPPADGADAARAAARAGGRGARARARRAGGARDRTPCSARSPPAGPRPPGRWRRSPPAACAGWSRRCSSPQRAEPDPEPMRKGSLAHAVLETTLRGLKERTGSARLGEDTVDAALAELERALGAVRASRGRELATARGQAALRALEEDLVRYLRHEAETGAGLEPEWLEWSFGREGDSHGALALNGSGYSVTGRVDRIDVDGGGAAVIRDYKGKTVHAGRALGAGRPAAGGAVRAGGARAARAASPRARSTSRSARATGARAGSWPPACPGRYVNGDVVAPEALDAALLEARDAALAAARAMKAGRIRPCPSRCSPNGCAYPGICRAGERRRRRARERAALHRRAAGRDRGPLGLGPAGRQRRLGQDRGDGRALRRGGAARRASRSARSSR